MVTERVHAAAKVTSKGQITVPRAVRERLRLSPGDEIEFVEDEHGMYVRRVVVEDVFGPWLGYAKHLEGVDVDELIEEMRGR